MNTKKHNGNRAAMARLLVTITPALILMLISPAAQAGSARKTATQGATGTIEVIRVFDYPAQNALTLPEGINDQGDISGSISPLSNFLKVRGFLRLNNGHFTPPISDPNAHNYTTIWGLNNARTLCGFYYDPSDGDFHSFFLFSDGTFSPFAVDGAESTDLYAINDIGNFCGDADFTAGEFAWVSLNGVVTFIDIDGATSSAASGINNLNEVVGSYTDSTGAEHGYFRDGAGNITAPIDISGAASTELRGINDNDLMVGRYYDSAGESHGFAFKFPNKVIVFDYPGSSETALNGINNAGQMVGYYKDATTQLAHGVVARVR